MTDHRDTKKHSSTLKMRSQVLRLLGTTDARFEAIVLLHEAARLEAQIAMDRDSDPRVRVVAAVEECGCYIDASAPRWAEMAWRRIRSVSQEARLVPPLDRIEARYLRQQEALRAAVAESPELISRAPTASLLVNSERRQRLLRRELRRLLVNFSGDSGLWFAQYRAMDGFPDVQRVDPIARAARISPENGGYRALFFDALSRVPEYAEGFQNLINDVFQRRSIERPEVLGMLVLTLLRIARVDAGQRTALLRMAAEVLNVARGKVTVGHEYSDQLARAQLLFECSVQGREPSEDELRQHRILAPETAGRRGGADAPFSAATMASLLAGGAEHVLPFERFA